MKKILTDVAIPQSKKWVDGTTLADSLLSSKLPGPVIHFSNHNYRIRQLLNLLMMLIHFRKYDVVINAPGKGAQLLAFIRTLLKLQKPRQIILELMLDEEAPSMVWRLKRWFQKFAFSSIDTIFVSSSKEVNAYAERLGISSTKVTFLPFHTDITKPQLIDAHQGYVFSAGKTGRDFQTLIEAVRDTNTKVVIISDEYHARGLNVPENVKVLINVPYSEYLYWLRNSWFVVVPLKRLVKSTGQVVILEAMGYGKPVIATETTGTVDYIINEHNGLFIPTDNPAELMITIERLKSDRELFLKIAQNGLETVKRHHTFDAYVGAILEKAYSL